MMILASGLVSISWGYGIEIVVFSEVQIQQDDVRLLGRGDPERLGPCRRLTDDRQVRMLCDDQRQARTDYLVIIHQEDANVLVFRHRDRKFTRASRRGQSRIAVRLYHLVNRVVDFENLVNPKPFKHPVDALAEAGDLEVPVPVV